MKIVVTGAAGLIGSHTAEYLHARGHEVIGVDLKTGELSKGIKMVVGDITDLAFCDQVISTADAVVHLGAIPNPTDVRQFNVFKNNTLSLFSQLQLRLIVVL
jgi:nucleoside-diphosphate-sugar epimerase